MNDTTNALTAKMAGRPIDLLAYWHCILNYKWRILLFAAAFAAGASLWVSGIPPVYRATSTILIKSEQENAVSIEDIYTLDTSRKEYFMTQYEILASKSIAKEVIDALELATHKEFTNQPAAAPSKIEQVKMLVLSIWRQYFPADTSAELSINTEQNIANNTDENERVNRIKLIQNFQSRLTISPAQSSQIVRISFDAKDPVLAAAVVNKIGEAYINQQYQNKLSVTKKAVGWLGSRLKELRANLDASEENLQQFRKTEDLVDLEGISSIAASELEDLSKSYLEAKKRRVQAESTYIMVKSIDSGDFVQLSSLTEISNHPALQEIRRSEIEAQKSLSEIAKRYGPKHPKRIAADARMSAVSDSLRNQVRQLVTGIEQELTSAKEAELNLFKQLEDTRQKYQAISITEADYLKRQREVETNRNLYNTFLSRFKETDITTDFESEQARFIDKADAPINPIKPNKKLIVIMIFIAALGFAILMALVYEGLNKTVRGAEDVEYKLGFRLMGLIPLVHLKRGKNLSATSYLNNSEQNFSEAIRTIRTSIILSNMDTQKKSIAITSSIPGEGKTTVSINLALSLAQMEKTILIEADMRLPTFNQKFDFSEKQSGLSDVILGQSKLEDAIIHTQYNGLDVLTAGNMTDKPLELLSASRFNRLIDKLAEHYDRIIIDTPPTQAVSDAYVVSRVVDSVLYVVKSGNTNQITIKAGLGRLQDFEAKIDGVILNHVDLKKAGYQYGHYYHNYGYRAAAQA